MTELKCNGECFTKFSRFQSLDGLRGLLAFFVFIHHFSIFYSRQYSGVWQEPASDFFNNLGVVSVSIFFMITGFLFHSRYRSRDFKGWFLYFCSKFVRLMPVYYLSVFFIFAIAVYKYDGELNYYKMFFEALKWLLLVGNSFGYSEIGLINAGVEWSLRYEVLFYLVVPFCISIFNRVNLGVFLILSAPFFIYFYINPIFILFNTRFLIFFFLGVFCSFIYQRGYLFGKEVSFRNFNVTRVGLGFLVFSYSNTLSLLHVFLIFLFFSTIIYNHSSTNFLSNYLFQRMGRLSYCFYLFHGIFLFVFFDAFTINSTNFPVYIFLIFFGALLFSSLVFNLVESRSLTASKKVNNLFI